MKISYPIRCQIIDVTGKEVLPGLIGNTPDSSREFIGQAGTAMKLKNGDVQITLDSGHILMGWECWWKPIK